MVDLSLGSYRQNMNRANELIAYAKPYRLNIVTDQMDYLLVMEDGRTGARQEMRVSRSAVDVNSSPVKVLHLAIDKMRQMLDNNPATEQRKYAELALTQDLRNYAAPFELSIDTSYNLMHAMTYVNMSVKNPDYGFDKCTVTVPDSVHGELPKRCKESIDKMRRGLGWKSPEELAKEMPIGPAKPFILGCPDHGGQMVHVNDEANHDEYFMCLVPGCTKKARKKNRVYPGGTMHE